MGKALPGVFALICVGALALTSPASAETLCAHWHGDPGPSYTGPVPVGISCRHSEAPSTTWTVPEDLTSARFYVDGASDPESQSHGGHVEASLDLTPGSKLTLEMGGPGEASAVRSAEGPLIVAGGGNGEEPNFVTPSAVEVESIEPGDAEGSALDQGWISVEWTYFYEGEQGEDEPGEGEQGQDPDHPNRPEEEAETSVAQTEEPVLKAPVLTAAQSPTCVVPFLKGRRPVEARRTLAVANCTLGDVSRRSARRHRRGRVVRQSLASGMIVPQGTEIDIVVGRRP